MSDQEERRKDIERIIRKILINLLSVLIAGILTRYGSDVFINVIWPKVTSFWQIWWLTLVGTVFVFLIGLGLYLFKKYHQKFYGLAEVGFALAVGWVSIMRAQSTSAHSTSDDAASWLAIVAAAYLVVRGLSNYYEAEKPNVNSQPTDAGQISTQ